MGILTKGRYTYGNKTYAQIITLSGSVTPQVGDTVFDTTNNRLRQWDGSNFVHPHQRSIPSEGGLLDGACMVASSTTNNRTNFQQGTTDTEGIIGIAENAYSGSGAGTNISLTYYGSVAALIAGATTVGEYVRNDTTNLGYTNGVTTPAVGVFGVMYDTAIAAGAVTRSILFKPVTRF